ncbi:MAG: glycosyltransferase family 4 protein [Cyanobacteria bacterium]|nr:glycosyltransferase family 4 protein [Cyanobacteriota bacterium]
MNILIFTWRDIKNPCAGGAEIFTHEICKRLICKGHNITLFTSKFSGCLSEEIIDGVRLIRYGSKYSVYFKAKNFYKKFLEKENYDLIIDQINTIPFFTPTFVDKRIISLIYQLSREFWFYETKFPINFLGYYLLEYNFLRNYLNIPTITISQSTETDLKKLKFKEIYIVQIGLQKRRASVSTIRKKDKKNNPILIFIGRLTKSKKPYDILKAFSIVCNRYPEVKLYMVGDGYLRDDLVKFSKRICQDSKVTFFGYSSEEEKFRLLSESSLLLVSGVREGWGMVVTEANSVGIPAIGYDIPGIRDSILDGETGLLSRPDPGSMAERIIEFLSDDNLQEKLSKNALEYSKAFSWDKSAEEFEKVLKSVYYE